MMDLSQCKSFLRSVNNDEWNMGEIWAEGIEALEERLLTLESAILRALEDCESGDGYGPDVTVCDYLRDALKE